MVPPGCIAHESGQWCLNPNVIEYVNITFSVPSLMHYLREQLDELGYTESLHNSILEAQKVLQRKSVVDHKQQHQQQQQQQHTQSQKRPTAESARETDGAETWFEGRKWMQWNGAWWTQFDGNSDWWLKKSKNEKQKRNQTNHHPQAPLPHITIKCMVA